MNLKIIIILVVVAILVGIGVLFDEKKPSPLTSFEECIKVANVILESYPRQCRTEDGKSFVEDIGNELEKSDLIIINTPRPNTLAQSPLFISGSARGYWFFEASFPVTLLDGNGNEIAKGVATAKSEWMTENFVPFEAILTFAKPVTAKGTLVLHKDNPSGLVENEDMLRVPIVF